MSIISIPFTFTVGAVIVASQHNSCFSTIYSDYNGNITAANLSASAAIADTQLGQITTAGKVSGAALTSLSSIPGGAGSIPTANLPAISLTSGVSGILPVANGGTGTSNSLFSAWTSGSDNTSTLASANGFVIGFVVGASPSVSGFTDSSNPPTTERCRTSGTGLSSGFIIFPVRKGDYWKVTGLSGGTIYFLPIGT